MMLEPSTWVLLILLGGWVAADSTSMGQVMVSRPLVSATLAGWIAGDPVAGAAAGLILELFHLTVLPVGAARYPESGPPAVVVGAVFAISDQHALTLLTAVVFSLIWEMVSAKSVRGFRRINGRLVGSATNAMETEAMLEQRHLAAIGLDVLRGAMLVGGGILLLQFLIDVTPAATAASDSMAETTLHLSVVVLLAGALRLFGSRLKFVAAGAVVGLLILLLRT
jgi:mannose/fructose/N-acetylgalactosamine-specific phosphotransferase system component IIC